MKDGHEKGLFLKFFLVLCASKTSIDKTEIGATLNNVTLVANTRFNIKLMYCCRFVSSRIAYTISLFAKG
jgi:putative Mn2+ efflux pump MntP